MTTEDARVVAAEFQDRADQMGNRTGEGVRLGQAASVIRDLCAQIEAHGTAEDPLEPETEAPRRRGRPPKVREDAE